MVFIRTFGDVVSSMISKAFNISLFNVGEIKVPEAWCTPSGRCVLRRTEGSGKGDVAQSRLLGKWLLHLHLRDAVCSWATGAVWRQSAVGSWPQRGVTAAQCSWAPPLIFCPRFSWVDPSSAAPLGTFTPVRNGHVQFHPALVLGYLSTWKAEGEWTKGRV